MFFIVFCIILNEHMAVGVVYFAYQQPDRGAWPLLVGCCGAVLLCLLAYVLSRRCSYEITNRRVVMHSGLIMRSTREVRVEDIRAINVVRKGLRSLLGVGSVEFSSAGGAEGEVVFRDITGCQHVRQLVRHLQG